MMSATERLGAALQLSVLGHRYSTAQVEVKKTVVVIPMFSLASLPGHHICQVKSTAMKFSAHT